MDARESEEDIARVLAPLLQAMNRHSQHAPAEKVSTAAVRRTAPLVADNSNYRSAAQAHYLEFSGINTSGYVGYKYYWKSVDKISGCNLFLSGKALGDESQIALKHGHEVHMQHTSVFSTMMATRLHMTNMPEVLGHNKSAYTYSTVTLGGPDQILLVLQDIADTDTVTNKDEHLLGLVYRVPLVIKPPLQVQDQDHQEHHNRVSTQFSHDDPGQGSINPCEVSAQDMANHCW